MKTKVKVSREINWQETGKWGGAPEMMVTIATVMLMTMVAIMKTTRRTR